MSVLRGRRSLQLDRRMAELDRLRIEVAGFYRSRGGVESAVSALELSAYEAASNVIEHGGPDFRDMPISIELQLEGQEAKIILTYRDREFDVSRAPLPDVEEHYRSGRKRGLGIYFIRSLMDHVAYRHEDMVSTLTMTKKISGTPDSPHQA